MKHRFGAAALFVLLAPGPATLAAQSWRVRMDAAAQRVSFRGVSADSILESEAISGPTGGLITPDGYAVACFGDGFCRYYRAGAIRRGVPASASADLTMWGLGLTGLRIRVHTRTITDLSGDRLWPGTSPSTRLVEGFAEYIHEGLTAVLGRTLDQGRLGGAGASGLDGLRAGYRFSRQGLELGGYAGWGLARGTILPVTSPAVNPLAEYQPGHRQFVAGARAGYRGKTFDAEAEYRREIDTFTRYFVAERAAVSLAARPAVSLRISGGADYDVAAGLWGSADAAMAYSGRAVWATAGVRRYRPFFDLWTVWGVFSPVPYEEVHGSLTVAPMAGFQLRARGSAFRYDETGTSTPAVVIEDQGWRWGVEGSYAPDPRWSFEAGAHGERLPGASSRGIEARIGWRPRDGLDLAIRGGDLERPLELRFQDAGVTWLGGSAEYQEGERWRVGVSLDRYWESRVRPDAAAFDWNQWRLSARVALTLRSSADRWELPRARPEAPRP